MMQYKLTALAALALSASLGAQDARRAKHEYPLGVSRVGVSGPIMHTYLDLDSGRMTSSSQPVASAAQAANSFLCYANNVDQNDTGGLGDVYDALLFPKNDELFDWGIKFCGGSRFVDKIRIGYASMAQNSGGRINLRVYAGGQGFGIQGRLLRNIALKGLPSDGNAFPLIPHMLTIDLGSKSFFLPEGPIGWSYQTKDGLTAPLLVDAQLALGTQNYFDLYRPVPATSTPYVGTFMLPAGGLSNDPLENSFFIEIFQTDATATSASLAAGSNPDALSSTSLAIVGQTYQAQVDLGSIPGAIQSFMVVTGQLMPDLNLRAGTLIVDLSTVIVPLDISPTGAHSVPIPLDSALVDQTFYVQGAVGLGGGGYQLTNGLSVSIGTF